MSTLFDIIIGGTAASDFDTDIVELEVEENADLPGAFSITLPVTAKSSGDYDTVSDPRLAPLSNIAVTAQAADGQRTVSSTAMYWRSRCIWIPAHRRAQ
jgi:hypothetical protein